MMRGKELRRNARIRWCIVFFDFKSAYNTVNRSKLYQHLKAKNILNEEEVNWLEDLHSRITIKAGGAKIRPLNGLHQGSMISPLLFDIYVEDMVERIHQRNKIPIEDILFYADDLAIICTNNQVERVVNTVEESAASLSLIINRKKSGILPIQNSRCRFTDLKGEIKQIPIVKEYRYLGVDIDQKLEIEAYMNRIKRKVDFIYSRIAEILRGT